MLGGSPVNAQRTPGLYDGLYNTSGLCERESSTEVPGNRGKALIVDNHHMIGEGDQEAAIEAFLAAHKGHTQEVEVQRGTWSIYCHCKRCGDIHTYEVDNEARQQALGLPPWQEEDKKPYSTATIDYQGELQAHFQDRG
jgi:hypothetical protein